MSDFKMIEPVRDIDDPIGYAEGLSFEEARKRAMHCGFNLTTKPMEIDGRWFCVRCGVEMVPNSRNKLGYMHSHMYPTHTEKVCVSCKDGVKKPLANFYTQGGSLDNRRSSCKDCVKKQEASRRKELNKHSSKHSVQLKNELWNTIDKVRGRQSRSQFVNQAIRAEIERRVKLMWLERGKADLRREGEIEATMLMSRKKKAEQKAGIK